jgi:hypothetical protein
MWIRVMRNLWLFVLAFNVHVVGCAGFLTPAVIKRPVGLDCVAYEWVIRRPRLGAAWGQPEFVGMTFTQDTTIDNPRAWTRFAGCPASTPVDAPIAAAWNHWRLGKLQGLDRASGNYWDNIGSSAEPPKPIALVPVGSPTTAPVEGVLYQYEKLAAFFPACSYWADAAESVCQR